MSDQFAELGKELQKLRDDIGAYVIKWLDICNLRSWDVESLFQAEPDDVCPEASACVTVQWQYKTVVFRWRLVRMLPTSPGGTERIVVHEICHVLVNGMRGAMNWDENDMLHEERVVTELADCLLNAYREIPAATSVANTAESPTGTSLV